MSYFILIKDNQILNATESKTLNEDIIDFEVDKVLYNDFCENPNKYLWDGEKIVLNENYEAEQAEERKNKFYQEFISTSLGNYRLEPKGYANAQQSIDLVDRFVSKFGALTEQLTDMMLFYKTPDFTKPEQCTEKWLVNNQYNPDTMTIEEWEKFYFEFSQLYAMQQYKTTTVNGGNNENTTNTEQSTDVPNEVDTKENNTKLDKN